MTSIAENIRPHDESFFMSSFLLFFLLPCTCNLTKTSVVLYRTMSTGPSDIEIISAVLNGNQQVYAQIVQRHQTFVFSLVLRYIKSREDAEEVAQDVFVKAYKALADFKGASKFSTWLYTIVTTTCISFLRKKKLETHSLDNEKVFETIENQHSGTSANQVEQKSKVAMVNNAIALLNADDAEIVTLFYKGEQTLDEIAKILGIESNTVKVRLHRARTRLKEKMQRHFAAEVRDIY